MADLQTVLGTRPPEEFAALTEAEAADLAGAVQDAMEHRSALIDKSIEDSLRHLPAMLRGTVRRALGM
jgi:hypothetical protein